MECNAADKGAIEKGVTEKSDQRRTTTSGAFELESGLKTRGAQVGEAALSFRNLH